MKRIVGLSLGAVLLVPHLLAQPAGRVADPLLRRIQPEWISAHVRFLSDALLEGRETGTRGAELAAKYVAAEFEKLGLAPLGASGSFLAPVPLRLSELRPEQTSLTFTTPTSTRTWQLGSDYLVHPDKQRDQVSAKGGVVFVGWGVTAPERGYDDYRGLDVRGKFVAMLFGGPPSVPPDERGHYAGLAIKEQNALARGAVGVITVMPAPGPILEERLGMLEGFGWLDRDGRAHSPFFESGATIRLADKGTAMLFQAAGRSLEETIAALAKGPVSFPIEGTIALEAAQSHRTTASPNVVGMLEGSDPALKHEYVVYSAHLDHIGLGAPVNGDSVYHGAIDNAGGTAVLMALARASASIPRPKRSVIFLAVTGEEKGILGSDYFVRHPPVPADRIVANVNLDNFVMINPLKDLVAYGAGYSTLESDVTASLRRLGLTISEDPLPWMTIFTRSDHYSFMRLGIPGVMLFPGNKSGSGTRSGSDTQRHWFDSIHHTPLDRVDQGIDWNAGVTYAEANLLIGTAVANRTARPRWRGRFFFHEAQKLPGD